MSDRLAVMSNGRVEQEGAPREVYEEPATAYVADFLGVSNLMDATAQGPSDGRFNRIRLGDFDLRAERGRIDATGDVRVTIRPERVVIESQGSTGLNRVPAILERKVYLGPSTQLILSLPGGGRLQALLQNQGEELPWHQGGAVTVCLPAEALRVLD